MKYIKMFNESSSFSVEDYFKDKINWKMMEYIKDSCLKYTDEGHLLHIIVYYANNEHAPMSCVYMHIDNANSQIEEGFETEEAYEIETDIIRNIKGTSSGLLIYRIFIAKYSRKNADDKLPTIEYVDQNELSTLCDNVISKFGVEIFYDKDEHRVSLAKWIHINDPR